MGMKSTLLTGHYMYIINFVNGWHHGRPIAATVMLASASFMSGTCISLELSESLYSHRCTKC